MRFFTPNESTPPQVRQIILAGWIGIWIVFWLAFQPVIFPSPLDVLHALPGLWSEDGLGQELISSIIINVEALLASVLITLPLAYCSRVPTIRPLAEGAAKLRFLSPAAFFVPLLFMTHSGHQLKVAMLVTGEAFFLLTSMLGTVADIPAEQFDYARTLLMSEWKLTWQVVVRGTIPQLLSVIRDNAAMGWGMLMMVEGIVRSEGGIGVMLIDANKYRDFASVYAISLTVLVTGWVQDWGIGAFRTYCCPYAVLKAGR